ncbi:hypothetical protein [Streptosporangium sp. NPDC087985]|uniref:hypothetical protein n=1 Tax=Streptosporangium sp. NPDC087985 TaxID=3366196 RepID=UPI003812C64A
MEVLAALGGVALITLIVTLIVVGARAERKRQERIRQWAAGHGWTVTQRPTGDWGIGHGAAKRPGPSDWAARLPGRNRRGVSLLVSGVVSGRLVGVAEYSYETRSSNSDGSSSTMTHRYIVTAVRLDAQYPPITVVPRGALSRLGRTVFGNNAASTGHNVFDQQFRVDTRNPALARALLSPALIAEHLAGRIPAWSLAGPDLLAWQPGWIKDPDQIATLVTPLMRVAELLGR